MSIRRCFFIAALVAFLAGCTSGPSTPSATATPPLADTLTIYYYPGYVPEGVLEAFTKEYGVEIDYQTYENPSEGVENLLAGKQYDVVWISHAEIPRLVDAGVLVPIDPLNVTNITGLDANFRDLAYDPGNKYSVPYNWGTFGLIVRTDLFDTPITRLEDLWQVDSGPVGLWQEIRFIMGLGLQSLGYSVNSTTPDEIEAAANHLIDLKRNAVFVEDIIGADISTSAYVLAEGRIPIAVGWANDALVGQELDAAIRYVLPEEGTMLWSENMAVSATSEQKYTAELFINFMLRPEIAAQYTNTFFYAVSSDAARAKIKPEILSNEAIYPSDEAFANAEFIVPLPPDVQALYDAAWQRFLDAPGASLD